MWYMELLGKIERKIDRHPVEIQNSFLCVIVGAIFLLNNGRLYARSPRAFQMFEILPEWMWGLAFLSAGSLVIYSTSVRSIPRFVQWVLLVKVVLWVFLGTALVVGVGWWATAPYMYFVFAFFALYGYYKNRKGDL